MEVVKRNGKAKGDAGAAPSAKELKREKKREKKAKKAAKRAEKEAKKAAKAQKKQKKAKKGKDDGEEAKAGAGEGDEDVRYQVRWAALCAQGGVAAPALTNACTCHNPLVYRWATGVPESHAVTEAGRFLGQR